MELERYLQEIRKIKLLQPEEEQRLWYAYKKGKDEEARCRLIESYQPLVFKNALQFRQYDNILDIIQEGTVGLIEAVEKYNFERGVAFSLFAVHRIRGRILTFLHKEGEAPITSLDGGSQKDMSLVELIPDKEPSVMEQAEIHEQLSQLRSAMAKLPQKERLVLENVYLHSSEAKAVADMLQVSTSHIYRLQKMGIRRVRGFLSRFMQYW